MQLVQLRWTDDNGWEHPPENMTDCDMVLAFSNAPYFREPACYEDLRRLFPRAQIVGCSSSGSVLDVNVSDDDVVVTALRFDKSTIRLAVVDVDADHSAESAGETLMADLMDTELRHVFVLSDGLQINGSELAKGMNRHGIVVTGGLAGDGTDFAATAVMANAPAVAGRVAAIGFYGDIDVRCGCFSGWEEFGALRIVTRSVGNVVYEIDGEPALDLYRRYLGDEASNLPYSGLRFPLSIQEKSDSGALIRTLLAIDEANKSLTFAGDVPEGYLCKLMQANLDGLIDSAGDAADAAESDMSSRPGLCLLVSCVGRRLVMGQLTEEELEIVREKVGDQCNITGFYSYGELAPLVGMMNCQLHNQTMTLTAFYE